MINATLISDTIVAIRHPSDGISVRAGKNFLTLTKDEFAKLVKFATTDKIQPVAVSSAKARMV
jgi:hypothetical protein